MNVKSTVIGGLHCRLVDQLPAGRAPSFIVVLCHGFGAPGTDLVPLAPELLQINPALAERVQFVFPAAPLSLDEFGMYGGRAWWMIDIERFQAAIERGDARILRNDLPAGLVEARQLLTSVVEELQAQTMLPLSRFLLGGFSQGSMLATDVTLRLPESTAGLCVLSGTLLCEEQWRPLAARRAGLPVLQSHGTQDPILPFIAAEWLRDMLMESGLPVEFIPFRGMHTIPLEALERLAEMLEGLAGAE
jgi:phospholipase/carboxylesterase